MDDSLDWQIQLSVKTLADSLNNNKQTLAVAESCTGGWLAKVLTDLAGSSGWFNGGVVSYTNEAKQALLKVDKVALKAHGAVSEQVAIQMVEGALSAFDSSMAIAITGVAGPSGGTAEKPVGTVCFAVMTSLKEPVVRTKVFSGNREKVRRQAVLMAIQLLLQVLAK